MKIRLIIQDANWPHKLSAKLAPNGTYWVQLLHRSGQPFTHGKIIGGFDSLDRIVSAAPALYADLVSALPDEAQLAPAINRPDVWLPICTPTGGQLYVTAADRDAVLQRLWGSAS